MSVENDNLFAVDIGNTSCKIQQGDSGQRSLIEVKQGESFESLRDLPAPARWLACSVCRPEFSRLSDWLKTHRPGDAIRVLDHHDISLNIEVNSPEQVGMDRLAAAEMARSLYPESDLVVVDSGTAVTVDAIKAGSFLGGAIFAGSRTEFEALRAKAHQLPLVEEHCLPESPIGKSTAEAIQSGVLLGQIGSICHLVNRFSETLEQPIVVTTGGGLNAIQSELPSDWKYHQSLILNGVRLISERIDF